MNWEIFIKNSKNLNSSDDQINGVIDFLNNLNIRIAPRYFTYEVLYYLDYTSDVKIIPLTTIIDILKFDEWKEMHTKTDIAFQLLNEKYLTIFPFAIKEDDTFYVYETDLELIRRD